MTKPDAATHVKSMVEITAESKRRAVSAAEYRRAGLTYRAIAEAFGGLHVSTVYAMARKGERILAKREAK